MIPTQMFRAAAAPASLVFIGLAVAMAGCVGISWLFTLFELEIRAMDRTAFLVMLPTAMLVGGLSGALRLWARGADNLGRREAILAVNLIWFGAILIGSLPYLVTGALGPIDALFESTSGFTTTGATVVSDIEGTLSYPLLL